MLRKNEMQKSVRRLRALKCWQVLVLVVALLSIPGAASAAKGGNGRGSGGGDKGGGNGGNVGGDVSGWIYIDALFDDGHLGDPDIPNGLLSDSQGIYSEGTDRVAAAVGRNRAIRVDLNTHKKKASIRKFKFQYVGETGLVPGFPPINVSCADTGAACFPALGSGELITCAPAPLYPQLETDGSAPDAELQIQGEDHDDTPVGCTRHVSARLKLTDVNGEVWWVFYGSRESAGGSFRSPCSSCVTVERLPNVDSDDDGQADDPGISQWAFSTEAPHIGYLYRDNNPPHGPSEFHGTVTLPFSGIIISHTEEPVPAGLCDDFSDSQPCP